MRRGLLASSVRAEARRTRLAKTTTTTTGNDSDGEGARREGGEGRGREGRGGGGGDRQGTGDTDRLSPAACLQFAPHGEAAACPSSPTVFKLCWHSRTPLRRDAEAEQPQIPSVGGLPRARAAEVPRPLARGPRPANCTVNNVNPRRCGRAMGLMHVPRRGDGGTRLGPIRHLVNGQVNTLQSCRGRFRTPPHTSPGRGSRRCNSARMFGEMFASPQTRRPGGFTGEEPLV
jgi:hypothetical protein